MDICKALLLTFLLIFRNTQTQKIILHNAEIKTEWRYTSIFPCVLLSCIETPFSQAKIVGFVYYANILDRFPFSYSSA